MARITTVLSITLLLLFAANLHAQTEDKISTNTPPEVSIAGTQLLSINSSIADKKYDLYINLPADYGDTTKIFPVVYLLDAQWDFTLMQSIYGQQYYDGFIPPMVIVGITWGGASPNYDSLRGGDFTPTLLKAYPYKGNAPKFLQFIKKELIPFIESRYRVKHDDRTLIGTSLGGLFTLYTLFHETNLFNRYVLTSPALSWENGIMSTYEKEFASKNTKLPVRLYMGIGQYEEPSAFNKFVSVLKSRNYTGLNLETRVLEDVGHSGTKPLGYTWGLQYVFARPSLNLDDSILKQYAGVYSVSLGMRVKISVRDNHLILSGVDGSERQLYAETQNDFYAIGARILIHFQKDSSGKVVGFRVELYGSESFAKAVTQ